MVEELKRIFGEEFIQKNLEIIPMDFRPLGLVGPEVIRHFQSIQDRLNIYKEYGGIIIGGGSWTDAYDQFGLSFKEHIGK